MSHSDLVAEHRKRNERCKSNQSNGHGLRRSFDFLSRPALTTLNDSILVFHEQISFRRMY
jgi:hypothetical protein